MKPIFRNSMFGFHKEDVYNFISKQSRVYEEKIKELSEENGRISLELENEKERFLSCEEKIRIFSEVENEIVALSSSIDEVLRCSEFCDAKNKEIKAAFSNMEERLAKAEAFREKAQKFDRLSGVLSSIFANKKDAEEIDSAAEEAYTPEKADFPENDGIESLLSAVKALEKHCKALNDLILDQNADE